VDVRRILLARQSYDLAAAVRALEDVLLEALNPRRCVVGSEVRIFVSVQDVLRYEQDRLLATELAVSTTVELLENIYRVGLVDSLLQLDIVAFAGCDQRAK
jgi:hypothetical protein